MLLGCGGIVDTRTIILPLDASCFAALASVAQRRATAPAPSDLSLSVRLISYLVKRQRDSMTFTVDTYCHVLPDFLVRPSPPYGPAASGVAMSPVIVDDPTGLAATFSIAVGVKTVSYVIDGEMSHDTRSNGTGHIYEANIKYKTSGQQQRGACGQRLGVDRRCRREREGEVRWSL
jgi:hypothetical protein